MESDKPLPPPANAVTVVVAVDENYVPHLGALLESIKASFSKDRFLELFVLDGGVQPSSRVLLEWQFFNQFKRGTINFIDCSQLYKDTPTHSYLTTATFYRISAGRLLPNHKKILYLDTDMIVLTDISVLFDTELDHRCLAAVVPDLYMKSCIAQGHKKKIPRRVKGFGGIVVDTYLRDYLKLANQADNYFNAGMILLNLDGFRNENLEATAAADLTQNKYWLLDQDVLNKCLKGRIMALDFSWNMLASQSIFYQHIPPALKEQADKAYLHPKIIHYVGSKEKPWNTADAPLAHFYWFFLRRTVWYEQVLRKADWQDKTLSSLFARYFLR